MPETAPTDTSLYADELAAVNPLTARAARDLQNRFLNPLGVEGIDAARLAEARQQIGADNLVLPGWHELSDDDRAISAVEALHYLCAARSIGLAR